MYNFKLEIGKLRFQASLERRVTVIDDDSGKCKTRIYDTVRRFPGNRAKIVSDLPVKAVTTTDDIMRLNVKSIIIIDEDCECLKDEERFYNCIVNSEHFFIIICRENVLHRIPYGVDDVKMLERTAGWLTLQPKYGHMYESNSGVAINKVAVEDSTTGLLFFKHLCKDSFSYHGKMNWDKAINELGNGGLIVLDRCGFGSAIKDFYNALRIHREIQVLDYESFESFLLDVIGEHVSASDVVNVEDFYFTRLHEVLPQYGKTANCLCFQYCNCKVCVNRGILLDCHACFNRSKYSKYVIWR